MRQVLYIEADEEMISLIGRLRKSPASENIIVAPHRSLILQSIVNLRLLNHDARKNGKEIIIVTQDEQSRSLCEKAGIQTRPVLDEEPPRMYSAQRSDGISPRSPDQFAPTPQAPLSPQPDDQVLPVQEKSAGVYLPFSDALGTTDFFGSAAMEVPPKETTSVSAMIPTSMDREMPKQQPIESLSKSLYGNAKQVMVRDQNPKKLTSLNSQRFEEEKISNQQKSFTPPSLRGAQPVRPLFVPPPAPVSQPAPVPMGQRPSSSGSPFLSQHPASFLEHRKTEMKAPVPQKMPEKQVVVSAGGKMRAFFIFFSIISIFSVAGVGAYLFLPKADIHVKLKVTTQKSDFEFDGSSKTTAYSAESKTIPVRMVEADQEISHSFKATGKASLADQKARGSVIVYNEYNADPQTLVASTRLLSQDGKVFRLLSGVIVPGMTTVNGKLAPGAIEAIVTADQPGQEYNIAATTFTIPGFEGSAKYAKFYAKSSSVMSGGGVSGSDVAAVSDRDIAEAKKTIEAEAKDTAVSIVSQDLADGEKALSEATDVAIVSSSTSPQSGAVTETFEYRVKIHIRTLVFSETDLKKMIITLWAQQNTTKGVFVSPSTVDLQYGEPTADFSAETLLINVHAVGHSEASLDEAQLKSDLLGKNESDLAILLQKYTQVDAISIGLWPEFLSGRVPTRASRVTLTIEPQETKEGK